MAYGWYDGADFQGGSVVWLGVNGGTVSNWQNHLDPSAASFVVELPPGPLTPPAAAPYARALLRLAQ